MRLLASSFLWWWRNGRTATPFRLPVQGPSDPPPPPEK